MINEITPHDWGKYGYKATSYVNVKLAAKILGIKEWKVRELKKNGVLKGYMLGRNLRFKEDELRRVLSKRAEHFAKTGKLEWVKDDDQ